MQHRWVAVLYTPVRLNADRRAAHNTNDHSSFSHIGDAYTSIISEYDFATLREETGAVYLSII